MREEMNKDASKALCPLCASANTEVIDRVDTSALIAMYNRMLGRDILDNFVRSGKAGCGAADDEKVVGVGKASKAARDKAGNEKADYDTAQGKEACEKEAIKELELCTCKDCALKFFTPTVTGNAAFYTALQQFPWYYMDEKDEFSLSLPFIKENDSLLEIGAGRGAFYDFLQAHGRKGVKYTGLEPSETGTKMHELINNNDFPPPPRVAVR